jgi:hypothetical protein
VTVLAWTADDPVPSSLCLACNCMVCECRAPVATAPKPNGRSIAEPTIAEPVFVQSLPQLLNLAATFTEPKWLVHDFIPGDSTVMLHAPPREYKTLVAQALLVAVTTGTPAFGLERLHVAEAAPAWYITEEDGWWRVATRFGDLVHGAGLHRAPELLHVSAGKGLDLDTPEWQARIIATAKSQGYRLVVIDPLRSVTQTADQGPSELKPFALFLRRFIRETGAVVLIVHHDVKPPVTGTDQRRRPQRASGGGIFSIADSPIHVERIDNTRRLLVPSDFKFAAAPPPVVVRLEHGAGWLRLVGEDVADDAENDQAGLDVRIMDYLRNSPYSYGSAVAKGVRARKELVLDRLKILAAAGLADSVAGSKGIKWFAQRAA